MRISSVSWVSLLILAHLAVVVSHGTAILDAMAVLLFGYVIILVRTGVNHPTVKSGLSNWGQILHLEREGLKAVKLSGVVVVLSTAIILLPFSWVALAKITLSVLAMEMTALLILESSLRTRSLGNIMILAAVLAWFWCVHICSWSVVTFVSRPEQASSAAESWTEVLDSSIFAVMILIGSTVGLLALLRWYPERNVRFTQPRLWLFT